MAVTFQEMMKTPFVLRLVSRLKAPGLQLSNFYGIGPNQSPTETTDKRSLVYDLFDHTRTMAHGRGPYVGPGKIPPKRIGQGTAHLMRFYQALPLYHEKLFTARPLAGQIGAMDKFGADYVARQQKYELEKMLNAMEFMTSRMFRGGFSILVDGDNWKLRELGQGTLDVEYKIPATNLGFAPVGDPNGSTAIFSGKWQTTSTPIIQELLALNKASERLTGYVQKHVWINSTTYGYLLNNAQLSAVRGSANRIFDAQTGQQIATTEQAREQGFVVQFGAMPQFLFHVYDAVSHVTTDVDNDTYGDLSLYIPDNKALITPDPAPGEWYGLAVGTEPVRETDHSEVIYPTGMHTWSYPTNDPPGFEWRMLYNAVPLLYNPKASFYVTVAGET